MQPVHSMSTSKLKLNPVKTEFILFGSKKQREKLNAWFPIDILGSPLCPAGSVKNLGVWFDSDFSLSKDVQSVHKSCFIQLYDFTGIRQFLIGFLLNTIHCLEWPYLFISFFTLVFFSILWGHDGAVVTQLTSHL